jgi:hypothetical protein
MAGSDGRVKMAERVEAAVHAGVTKALWGQRSDGEDEPQDEPEGVGTESPPRSPSTGCSSLAPDSSRGPSLLCRG